MSTKIILKIDNRESKFKELINRNDLDTLVKFNENLEIKYENLELGDFIFQYNNQDILVFERKTLPDLASSIQDCRYSNQKLNLLHVYERKKIYYIIEGSIDYVKNEPEKDKLIGSIINTMIRDDIKIFTTKNVIDTYNLLYNISERLIKDINKYITEDANDNTKVLLSKKKKINSKEDCFKYQIMQLPGLSEKTATGIVERFHSMKEFYLELKDLTDDDKIIILSDIKINNRKISSKVVKSIVELMF